MAWSVRRAFVCALAGILALTLFLPLARSLIRRAINGVSIWPALKDINSLFQEADG